jgi:exopolysaccharide production protein ExoQ
MVLACQNISSQRTVYSALFPLGLIAMSIGGLLLFVGLLALFDIRAALLAFGLPLLVLPLMLFSRAVDGSKLAILFMLAISIFVLEAVFRVRAYDEKVVDFQILIKVASWLLLLAIAAMNAGHTIRVITSTPCLPWTIVFIYFVLTSLYAPNPVHSAVAALSILSFYIFFASVTNRIEFDDVLLAILAGIIVLALASLVVYFVNPSFGRMRMWVGEQQVLSGRLSGLAGHPNTVGRLCCFGLLVVVHQWQKLKELWRPAPLLTLSLLVITLLLSNSRTSIGITIALLIIYAFARLRFLPYVIAVIVLALLAFVILDPYMEQIMQMMARSGKADEIATGTSRTHIWAVVETLIAQRPWLGWGYGSSVFIMPPYQRFMGHVAPHAHNIFLQVWLTTGLVGLVLFIFACATRLFVALRFQERFVTILLLFVILIGLSESSAFGGVANIATIALCLAATAFKSSTVPEDQLSPHEAASAFTRSA